MRPLPGPETLPPALAGERIAFDGLNCYVAGDGPPLLLVHSVNAAASAAEVRPLFDRYSRTHTVYALDLPGFGFSSRAERRYSPRLMTDALHAAVRRIRQRCGPAPVDALAVSLSCEFLARAAVESPHTFGRLALVSPTGLSGFRSLRKPPGRTLEVPLLHAMLTVPGWGPWLYAQLTRPQVVRFFLERTWGSPAIDEAVWAYAVQTSQVRGAWHAPLDFVAGRLFSADIHDIYERVLQPVWFSHGVRGSFTNFRAVERLPRLARWRRSAFLAGAMPYFERLDAFADTFDAFLEDPGTGTGTNPSGRADDATLRDAVNSGPAGRLRPGL